MVNHALIPTSKLPPNFISHPHPIWIWKTVDGGWIFTDQYLGLGPNSGLVSAGVWMSGLVVAAESWGWGLGLGRE